MDHKVGQSHERRPALTGSYSSHGSGWTGTSRLTTSPHGRRRVPLEGIVVGVFGMAHSRRSIGPGLRPLLDIPHDGDDEVRNCECHTHASSVAATVSAQHKPTDAAPNAACAAVNCEPYSEESWSIRP